MKKRVQLIGILMLLLSVLLCFVLFQNRKIQFEVDGNEIYVSIKVDNRVENIFPWYSEKEDLYYFFLPSCIKQKTIYADDLCKDDIKINGLIIEGKRFDWDKGEVYNIEINGVSNRVKFMKSANIPAFFIETESGSMDSIHASQSNEESGNLTVVSEDGSLQYSGSLTKITGRGSSTWLPFKKPYSIELSEKYPLCGLSANHEWKLLALYYEQDKIHSKIIYDLGRKMGIKNTPESTWVDLYCQGEYMGLYLLTENIAKNEKGRYLIEKTLQNRIKSDESYFSLEDSGFFFKFTKPRYPTIEQQEETAKAVQRVDALLLNKDMQYMEYLDMDSFAKQFLIDKIVMEVDAMSVSTFFYVEGDTISAGPLWDYDRAIGEIFPDYSTPIEGVPNWMWSWYTTLYENEEFYNVMVSEYVECLPYFHKIIEEDIDDYVEKISASVEMDSVKMENLAIPDETCSYREYESYVKYLKYFLANRLNYLGELWGVKEACFLPPSSTEEFHKVVFLSENGTVLETRYIRDGECIEDLPSLDENIYHLGWYFNQRPDMIVKMYCDVIPVYEDMILYAAKRAIE